MNKCIGRVSIFHQLVNLVIQRTVVFSWLNLLTLKEEDFVFKGAFHNLQEAWYSKYGWPLFKPLNEGDEYHLVGLHIPVTASQAEFDSAGTFPHKNPNRFIERERVSKAFKRESS